MQHVQQNMYLYLRLRFSCILCYVLIGVSLHAQSPLYLHLNSHSETTDPYYYAGDSLDYALITGVAHAIADTVNALHAAWNIQVDANYILGDLHWGHAADSADDFLEWADASPYLEVNAHNHFDSTDNPYNYADLTHLLDSCGIFPTSHVLGGFFWQLPDADWLPYENPVHGFAFPDYVWQADLLTGGGSPDHLSDNDDFGVWRPAGATALSFIANDSTKHLVNIGSGCKDLISFINGASVHDVLAGIQEIIDWIAMQPDDPDAFYTAHIMLNFREFALPGYADSIGRIIAGLQADADAGKIIWSTLSHTYASWLSFHPSPSDYFHRSCDLSASGLPSPDNGTDLLRIYPDPASSFLYIHAPQAVSRVALYALTGALVSDAEPPRETQLYYALPPDLPDGMYILEVYAGQAAFRQKLIIRH